MPCSLTHSVEDYKYSELSGVGNGHPTHVRQSEVEEVKANDLEGTGVKKRPANYENAQKWE